jgi:hypothetical protein
LKHEEDNCVQSLRIHLVMKQIFTFLFIAVSALSWAQRTETTPFVVLHTGEKLSGSALQYEMPILKSSTFQLDDKQLEASEVAFFQNFNGFFANLNKIHGEKSERFAMRIKSGKVNLFEEIPIEIYGKGSLDSSVDELEKDMLATGRTFQYYSVAQREVRKATYGNMKVDLADNPAAMKEVKTIRRFQLLQGALVSAGASFIAYSIVQQSGGAVRFNPMMALGIIVSGSSLFMENSKENARWLAVDAYNR